VDRSGSSDSGSGGSDPGSNSGPGSYDERQVVEPVATPGGSDELMPDGSGTGSGSDGGHSGKG